MDGIVNREDRFYRDLPLIPYSHEILGELMPDAMAGVKDLCSPLPQSCHDLRMPDSRSSY